MENNLLTHTKHETTHFNVLSDKRQTVKVSFLPFAGKINVKLNLSNDYRISRCTPSNRTPGTGQINHIYQTVPGKVSSKCTKTRFNISARRLIQNCLFRSVRKVFYINCGYFFLFISRWWEGRRTVYCHDCREVRLPFSYSIRLLDAERETKEKCKRKLNFEQRFFFPISVVIIFEKNDMLIKLELSLRSIELLPCQYVRGANR